MRTEIKEKIKSLNTALINWYNNATEEEIKYVNPTAGYYTILDVYEVANPEKDLTWFQDLTDTDMNYFDKDFDRVVEVIEKRHPEFAAK